MIGQSQPQTFRSGGRRRDSVPVLAQGPHQSPPDGRVVLDEQHVHHVENLSDGEAARSRRCRTLRTP
jgi:hypothetical protein